jgi:predicted unusual protein kinase regulating ubiquinone biosynthesis (AarF/ABC1/UbiB family)
MYRLWHIISTLVLLLKLRLSKSEASKQKVAQALAKKLAKGRGLPMKVGQIMAGMDDKHTLQPLTQSVAPLPLNRVKKTLSRAWGKKVYDVVKHIDESHAAASLGQVHRAVLCSGETVAIKVQYPDIGNAVQTELKLAGLMPRGGPVKRWDFNLSAYKSTLKVNMQQELDYLHEMKAQQRFGQQLDVQGLAVPKVFSELCHTRVLVQEWVEGERLAQVAASWSQLERLSSAKTLMQTMFQSLFQHGLVHGDPHPGNYFYQKLGQGTVVHLLDYGCMIEVSKKQRMALLQLILTSRGEMSIDPLEGFVAVGFDALKLQAIEKKLPALMQIIFRPFILQRALNLEDWHPAEEVDSLLGQQKWLFRAAGPADLFLLMRVFQGLVLQLKTLHVSLPWWPILQQSFAEDFMAQVKAAHIVKRVVMPSFHGTASALHVCIEQPDKADIHFELPAASALDLASLMPCSSQDVIRAQDIDILAITNRLQREGLHPSTLIDITDGDKRYHIYLS